MFHFSVLEPVFIGSVIYGEGLQVQKEVDIHWGSCRFHGMDNGGGYTEAGLQRQWAWGISGQERIKAPKAGFSLSFAYGVD